MISEFYVNGCILIANLFLIDKLTGERIIRKQSGKGFRILYGLAYGILSALCLFFTIHGPGEVCIDLRYIPIMLAALFAGPAPALVASLVAASVRLTAFGISYTAGVSALAALAAGCICALISLREGSKWWKGLAMIIGSLTMGSLVLTRFVQRGDLLLELLFFMWVSYLLFGAAALYLGIVLRRGKELNLRVKELSKIDYATQLLNYYGLSSHLCALIRSSAKKRGRFRLYLIECSDWKQLVLDNRFDNAFEIASSIASDIRTAVPDLMHLSRFDGGTLGFVLPDAVVYGGDEKLLEFLTARLGSKHKMEFVSAYSTYPDDAREAYDLLACTESKIYALKKEKWRLEQEKLILAERRRAVGELAAGMAHEIRNPLTTVRGFLQLAESGGDLKKWYPLIMGEMDRMVELTQEFLQYSKPKESRLRVLDARDLLDKCRQMTEPEIISAGHQLRVEARPDAPLPVLCDYDKISQVLINLIQNAVDAMTEPGELTLSLVRTDGDAYLAVTDTGAGIPASILPRIFDPFFSTKEDGTGLGLAIADKIIREHNGSLTVESRENHGTTFRVRLPAVL